MTTRKLLLTSLLTLTTSLMVAACVGAGTAGKNAPPNSGGDAAQSKSPEPEAEGHPPATAPMADDFSQPPQSESVPATGQLEQAPEQLEQSSPFPEHQAATAPAPAKAQARSAASRTSAPQASNADATASEPMRTRGESKASAAMQRPAERPGLATLWGETRESRVTTVSFNRSTGQPWSLLRVQYDDEAGILSRTGLSNVYALGSNIVETPNGFLTVQVIDGSGNPLAGLTEGSRAFVVGHTGDRYSIRVTNHSNERFEVVATVDGLDVLDGRPGSFVKRGYLVDANSSLEIDGFRRSTAAVAAFRFGSVKDSYAARTSGDRNVGVIGVAVFREFRRTYNDRFQENRRRDNADPFPNRFAVPPPPPAPVIRD